jgi:hypothetical protein
MPSTGVPTKMDTLLGRTVDPSADGSKQDDPSRDLRACADVAGPGRGTARSGALTLSQGHLELELNASLMFFAKPEQRSSRH